MKLKKIPRIFLFCAGAVFLIYDCAQDTLFDSSGHSFARPFAFVSLSMQNIPTLSDTAGFATIDTVPKSTDVYFIGLVSRPNQKITLSWNFGDGQSEDTSSIVKHVFPQIGTYRAYYTIGDSIGNRIADSVTVLVYTPPRLNGLVIPASGETGVPPSAPEGIQFAWLKEPSDPGDTVLSNILLGATINSLDTIARNLKGLSYYYVIPLLSSTTYYWRVVLRDVYGAISLSSLDSFTTSFQGVISKPTILSALGDTTVKAMDTLQFFVLAADSGGVITDYAWDWNGDGTYDTTGANLDSCKHVYQTEGTYRPFVRITDQNKKTDTAIIRIIVTPLNPTDKPVIQSISRDTTIKPLDSILLYANVSDANDTIKEYAWDFNGDGHFDTSGIHADSCVHRFANEGSFNVVFKATDQKGLFTQDTVKVTVIKEKLQLNFKSRDTIVDFGGTVRCSIRVNSSGSNLSFGVDTGHGGLYIPMNKSGSSASYIFSTGAASSWDSVKMRVTSPSTDTLFAGFKVDIRPRQLTITTIDSTDTTITVHWNQSLETDFQEYKLYRNTTSSVDTTGELVDSIAQASTVSYTIHVPDSVPMPRYYRLYQKDKEGVLSLGSDVVFGNIQSSPPSQPMLVTPVSDGDSILSNATIRWRRSIDPHGDTVAYELQINANNAGYKTVIAGATDTFFTLKNFDTLTFHANVKVIASNKKGVSSQSERLNVYLRQIAFAKMLRVKAGTITDDQGNTAIISNDFFMDTIEVNQVSYKEIMPNVPPQTNIGNQFPIQNVSWFEAIMYCNALSKRDQLDTVYTYTSINLDGATALVCNWDRTGYRLPTEDEWELAAKGGVNDTFATDNGHLSCSKANYRACGLNGTVIVAIYPPNPYGLHDLTGNVSEWCWDRFIQNAPGRTNERIDFSGPAGFGFLQARSVRGGSYTDNNLTILESSYRSNSLPTSKYAVLTTIGFRCVRLAP